MHFSITSIGLVLASLAGSSVATPQGTSGGIEVQVTFYGTSTNQVIEAVPDQCTLSYAMVITDVSVSTGSCNLYSTLDCSGDSQHVGTGRSTVNQMTVSSVRCEL
ncbi:hypothetical protein BO70DRAFT_431034 [Aspergillus heteromorphus CBS 117.55]|uniref:Uncharacterized protein n=1 Tax=Aspergillus heteromorphus CBS 117.55 TaxID=1448321 RepID=A0A317VL50_9EURO|nr:uncharacterized protein BO70DRAFT_431034 [Aspergillus heteromorphus CBS 117.55]PWY75046.1 hypothetical protein BO70DRAFT_431034 [Aspergillus heteromorphus CBS 117.55]